jgi:glycosyltransferase involved in cell wall biosynthesis
MKILLCHNHYQQPGGEDQVFADEGQLLESHGHEVLRYVVHNDTLRQTGRLTAVRKTLWNRTVFREVRALIRQTRPALMHCTNTFPLLSPAIYYAARAQQVPVVQSLHNFRLLCPAAVFLRNKQVCEDCLGKMIPWPGTLHGCYRGDRAASAAVTAMLGLHRIAGTWSRAVTRYIALSQFAKRKFVAGGLPAEKIAVKANFVDPDPTPGCGGEGYAIFVGRLGQEKGVGLLAEAWDRFAPGIPLKIVGDGPMAEQVQAVAQRRSDVQYLGRRPLPEVQTLIGQAMCLLLPSICHEQCPKTLLEALAKGTPVIASRLGALAELIGDGITGLLFAPGDAADMAAKVRRLAGDPSAQAAMRAAARAEFEQHYTADRNYRELWAIYQQALGNGGSDLAGGDCADGCGVAWSVAADARAEEHGVAAVPHDGRCLASLPGDAEAAR